MYMTMCVTVWVLANAKWVVGYVLYLRLYSAFTLNTYMHSIAIEHTQAGRSHNDLVLDVGGR